MDASVADAAFLSGDKRGSQRGEFAFLFLQKSQACPHHVARAAVAACVHLRLDEAAEVVTDAKRGVFGHVAFYQKLVLRARTPKVSVPVGQSPVAES